MTLDITHKISLVALDMDGTTLNSQNIITARNQRAITKAKESGIHVAIATGRMYVASLHLIAATGIDETSVFYNGGVLWNPRTKKIIYEKRLGFDLATEVFEFLLSLGVYTQIYEDKEFFVKDRHDPNAMLYESLAKLAGIELGDKFESHRCNANKFLSMFNTKDELREAYDKIVSHFGNRVYVSTTADTFLEVMHPDVNKGIGLKMLAKSYSIPREETMALGDGGNDIPMIEWAEVGVAVENAMQEVKNIADIIAPSNDDDAVAEVLEAVIENNKRFA
ncbi:MAG: Cof-type HAD-IIB family hydrolase [Synergistaceae bacterium]|nr:Cof-type HAD-IIB family hydrolase [Synergistaceae bacterium]